jgi:DNA helicase-2/ATP-dependent DNA helicase PcrA
LQASNEEDEAIKIVNEIKDLIERGYEHKDIAVLYRANNQSQPIEEAFAKTRFRIILKTVPVSMSVWRSRSVGLPAIYQRPMSDDGDDALRCIINIPNRYIGRRFINELEAYADQKGIRLYQALKSMRIDSLMSGTMFVVYQFD